MARFLVVDDDHPTVSGMARLLTGDGHEVLPLTAGADAVEALSRGSFDAVVTDLEMPHVDGHHVVRATRANHPEACLVVVTARPDVHGPRLIDAGVCIIADKPVDYEALTKSIRECRAGGGPARKGGCHMRRPAPGPHVVRLRRK
jgi:DNA-binding NtrC family response regulator